jgi:hypothetical protein
MSQVKDVLEQCSDNCCFVRVCVCICLFVSGACVWYVCAAVHACAFMNIACKLGCITK